MKWCLDIPIVTSVTLPEIAFNQYTSLSSKSFHFLFNSRIDISDVLSYHFQPYYIKCWNDVVVSNNITEYVVGNDKCNGGANVMNLNQYTELRIISIGDESFYNVDELHIEGLNKLENVTIGMNSFTKKKNSYFSSYSTRKFYLRNCPLLKEVRIGRYSFSDYATSYVENLESLELLEYGDMSENSYNFNKARYVSFESEWMNTEWIIRFDEFEDDDIWQRLI